MGIRESRFSHCSLAQSRHEDLRQHRPQHGLLLMGYWSNRSNILCQDTITTRHDLQRRSRLLLYRKDAEIQIWSAKFPSIRPLRPAVGRSHGLASVWNLYLVVPTGYGAYSVPGTARNDWYKVEFPVVQRNALAQAVKVVIGDKDGFPQSTGWLPNDSAYAELPAPNTDAIPVPPAEGTSTQTCKLQPITGGKAGILGYTCSCNTGPTPSPVTTSGTVSCPTATAA